MNGYQIEKGINSIG